MPNLVNKMVVRELTDELKDVEGMIVFSMTGLTVAENEELRDALADKGVRLRMVRNSLARLALTENGLELPDEVFSGNLAMTFGTPEETIQAAKVVQGSTLFKKDGKLAFRAGLLEGSVLPAEEARALADLPDRDTLNAMLLGVISGPARQLVGVVNALPSGLARVLQAHADSSEESDSDSDSESESESEPQP